MSRQRDINTYIVTALNANTQGLKFNLYYKYGINDGEFAELLINSTYVEPNDEAEDVKILYDGIETSTIKGNFEIVKTKYIPCIIEGFDARFEPLDKEKIISYSIPVSFFVDEKSNANNNDIFTTAIEEIQDTIRGTISTIGDYNSFINHGAITPISGLIEIGASEEDVRTFRAYQMTFYIELTNNGYFGRQIKYEIQNDDLFEGLKTEIFPLDKSTGRTIEPLGRQVFDTDTTHEYEIVSVPDISAFSLEIALLYDGDELTKHFLQEKYNIRKPKVYSISVFFPDKSVGVEFTDNYILESVTGPEGLGDKIIFSLSFVKASDKYNG